MTKHGCALFLLISGFVPTAAPQDASSQAESLKVESGPGPHSFDLDAASGDYKERYLQVPAGGFTVKGFIQFVTVRADRKWAPMGGIEVIGPHESFYAGLVAVVRSNAPDKIEFAVRDERLRGFPDASFGRVQLTDQAIPFELRLDRSGVLQASVAGKPGRTVSIRPYEIERVRFLGSTGHVRFLNVYVVASTE
jgi:hypothetical protein